MTSIFRSLLAALAATVFALVFAAVPASASSSSSAAAAVSLNDVRSELRQASDALDQIWGDDSGDDLGDDDFGDDDTDDPDGDFDDTDFAAVNLDAVAANLEHTAAARLLAQKVKKGKNRSLALIAVTDQADDNVFEYADDIGWVDASEQPTFVDALRQSVGVRGGAISALVAQAPKQTASTRGKLLDAIGDDLSDGDPEILLDTLAEEDGYGATPEVKDTVVPVLAGLLDDTDKVAADLRDLGDSLPSSERGAPRDAVDAIESAQDDLPDYVDELFVDFVDFDDPAAGAAAFCGYLAQLPLPMPDACG